MLFILKATGVAIVTETVAVQRFASWMVTVCEPAIKPLNVFEPAVAVPYAPASILYL